MRTGLRGVGAGGARGGADFNRNTWRRGEEETVRGLLASEQDGVTPAEHEALQVAAD